MKISASQGSADRQIQEDTSKDVYLQTPPHPQKWHSPPDGPPYLQEWIPNSGAFKVPQQALQSHRQWEDAQSGGFSVSQATNLNHSWITVKAHNLFSAEACPWAPTLYSNELLWAASIPLCALGRSLCALSMPLSLPCWGYRSRSTLTSSSSESQKPNLKGTLSPHRPSYCQQKVPSPSAMDSLGLLLENYRCKMYSYVYLGWSNRLVDF